MKECRANGQATQPRKRSPAGFVGNANLDSRAVWNRADTPRNRQRAHCVASLSQKPAGPALHGNSAEPSQRTGGPSQLNTAGHPRRHDKWRRGRLNMLLIRKFPRPGAPDRAEGRRRPGVADGATQRPVGRSAAVSRPDTQRCNPIGPRCGGTGSH